MNEAETKIVKQYIEMMEESLSLDVTVKFIIEQPEYEALKALGEDKPEADGWIKWEGGYPPVHSDIKVEVRGVGQKTQLGRAGHFLWVNDYGGEYDITHYRIVEEPKKPKKQTLLGYLCDCCPNFDELSTEGLMCKVSDYLEQNEG